MDLSTNIIKNYKSDYESLTKTISEFMNNPTREQPSKSPEGLKFYGFSFTTNKTHRYILPVIKEKMIQAGYKDMKWDLSEKIKTTYVYLYL